MKERLIEWGVNALVFGMILSIPAIIFAAFYFDNGSLLWWLALPIIFFMAG